VFLKENDRSLDLNDLTASSIRRFVQDQVINHHIKPRILQRRISCLKSLSQYLLKENYTKNYEFTAVFELQNLKKNCRET
jgi:integrase/recombinase XerD